MPLEAMLEVETRARLTVDAGDKVAIIVWYVEYPCHFAGLHPSKWCSMKSLIPRSVEVEAQPRFGNTILKTDTFLTRGQSKGLMVTTFIVGVNIYFVQKIREDDRHSTHRHAPFCCDTDEKGLKVE